jgi:hypothetical protein
MKLEKSRRLMKWRGAHPTVRVSIGAVLKQPFDDRRHSGGTEIRSQEN